MPKFKLPPTANLPPETTFEVRSDPWAMGRLHRAPQRDDAIALGFSPVGVAFVQVGSTWERARIGYATEVLGSPDRTADCLFDLFFDVGVIHFRTLLADGSLIVTRWLPKEAEVDGVARVMFQSRPQLGRFVENHREWDASVLWARHQQRVAEISRERGSQPVPCDMVGHFAMIHRGTQIARAVNGAFTTSVKVLLAVSSVGLVVAASIGYQWGWWPFAGTMVALSAVPWVFRRMGIEPWLPRTPWPTAAALRSAPWVVERVGDHRPVRPGFAQAPKSVQDRVAPRR